MLIFDGGLALLGLAVWIFCIIDVITSPEERCRNLPKVVWLLLVILLVDVGSIAWLVAGRTWGGASAPRLPLGRPAAPRAGRPGNPDDDEDFLAGLRARAEEQRRRAREAQRRAEDEPPAT